MFNKICFYDLPLAWETNQLIFSNKKHAIHYFKSFFELISIITCLKSAQKACNIYPLHLKSYLLGLIFNYSTIYLKTVDQKNEDPRFSQQLYHQFSGNSQEFTNLTPLNDKTLKKVYSSLCFKIGLIWLIKKLKILDFFRGF